MTLRKKELKNRIIAQKKLLESRIAELKANAQGKTADEVDFVKDNIKKLEEKTQEEVKEIKKKLKKLEGILHDGWDNLSEDASKRLSKWLGK